MQIKREHFLYQYIYACLYYTRDTQAYYHLSVDPHLWCLRSMLLSLLLLFPPPRSVQCKQFICAHSFFSVGSSGCDAHCLMQRKHAVWFGSTWCDHRGKTTTNDTTRNTPEKRVRVSNNNECVTVVHGAWCDHGGTEHTHKVCPYLYMKKCHILNCRRV